EQLPPLEAVNTTRLERVEEIAAQFHAQVEFGGLERPVDHRYVDMYVRQPTIVLLQRAVLVDAERSLRDSVDGWIGEEVRQLEEPLFGRSHQHRRAVVEP